MLSRYFNKWGYLPLFLLFFVAIQIPFLQADPHIDIAPSSRDAFTDEGLNTSQVINRVNHGKWVIDECDNLIKTPLFSLWLYPAYALFGTSTLVGRLWVLFGCIMLLYFASRQHKILPWIAAVFLIGSLTQYHLFQYVRFTMAEMMACFLVFTAIAYILKYSTSRNLWDIVWSAIFLWATVFLKNQFAYVLAFLPLWVLIVQLINHELFSRKTLTTFSFSILSIIIGGLLYYFAWYLPVKPTYDYVMADQAGGRFIPFSEFEIMRLQAETFLKNPKVVLLTYASTFSLLSLIPNFFISKNKTYRIISLVTLAWAVLEMHKFGMWFVPSRYLVPLLFSWGMFVSIQLIWSIKNALDYGWISKLVAGLHVIFIILFFSKNIQNLGTIYDERKFAIHETNVLLSTVDFANRPVVGPWAPALARETGARVIPVWFEYFNDEDLISQLNPKIIVTEADEGDSGGAFKNHGLNLASMADSVKNVEVGNYQILIYYLP